MCTKPDDLTGLCLQRPRPALHTQALALCRRKLLQSRVDLLAIFGRRSLQLLAVLI